jgi:hypothetical protein
MGPKRCPQALHDAAVVAERERTRLQSMASIGDLHSSAEREEITNLMALVLRLVRAGLVDTHRFKLVRYANTIIGCEAVDFLVEEGFASDRDDAARMCTDMLKYAFFQPVVLDAAPQEGDAGAAPQAVAGGGGGAATKFVDECVRAPAPAPGAPRRETQCA